MLDYQWGNPSTIMLSSDGTLQESDQNRQIFDPYAAAHTFHEAATHVSITPNTHFTNHHHIFGGNPHGQEAQFSSLFDPRSYGAGSASYAAAGQISQASLLSLEPAGPTGFMMSPKSEPVMGGGGGAYSTRSLGRGIGLNLGVRTYFSSSEDDFVNRLYRRTVGVEPGSVYSPRCQAEGCNADLTHAKHYHRRHKVCEFHSKAATVIAAGLTQRFCQQCSRFHQLSEFDNGKRSCRKRLAEHNRRRRKSQQPNQENATKSALDIARSSYSERSQSDSGAQTSSVTVAISPPRISLDCFRQRSYQATTLTPSSSASTPSLFFSTGDFSTMQ